MSPPPPSWLRAAPAAEVALRGARGVPGGSGASGAGRWERRRSGGWEWGREWRWPVSPEGRRCGEVSDGPCDGEAVRGPPAAGCGGAVRDVPWRVLSVVNDVLWRGAFVGTAVTHRAARARPCWLWPGRASSVSPRQGWVRHVPVQGQRVSLCPVAGLWSVVWGPGMAPVPARGVCVSPAAAG